MAGYSEFSFTSLWARIGGRADAALQKTGNAPRGVVVPLPAAERAALIDQIGAHLAELEALRRQTLATVDSRARILVPLAGGATLVALLIGGQGLAASVIFGLVAALTGWFIAMGKRAGQYQAAVKSVFAKAVSGYLSGFDHVVEPETDMARLRSWRLFPELQSARTLDRITGRRNGRSLTLSEMLIAYAPGKRGRLDHNLSVSVVEVASEAVEGALLVLTPHEAAPHILEAQRKAADLLAISTGDPQFDAAYSLRSDDPDAGRLLGPVLRGAILSLSEAGPAGRPGLVFLQGNLAVLFPTSFSDLAFHVPPYWEPIDADSLLAQFASDLALKNRLIDAVLNLPGGVAT